MRSAKISTGVWLCFALGVFGGVMVAAFYRTAHDLTRPAGAAATGVPAQSLKLAVVNVHRRDGLPDATLDLIRAQAPDYVFLHDVRGHDLAEIQKRLGGNLTSQAYYPLQNVADAGTDVGNAILSTRPLEDARPIPNHVNGTSGLWASTLVDGRRFYVACMRLSDDDRKAELMNLTKAWESLGKPPLLAAVEAGELALPQVPGLAPVADDPIWVTSPEWLPQEPKPSTDLHRVAMGHR